MASEVADDPLTQAETMAEQLSEVSVEAAPSDQPTEAPVEQQPIFAVDNSNDTTNLALPFFNGEQLSIDNWPEGSHLVGNDGQVYILVQNEKGEYFFSPDTENALLNQADGVQLSDLTAATTTDQSNNELQNVCDNPNEFESDKPTEELILQKDENEQTIPQNNGNTVDEPVGEGKIEFASDNFQLKESDLASEIPISKIEKQPIEQKETSTTSEQKNLSSNISSTENNVDKISKQSNSKIGIPKTKGKNDIKSTASRNVSAQYSANNIPQDSAGLLLGNFDAKFSQLANSPKTYSRPKNIQWITPSLKSNGIDATEETPKEKILTTTIEISEIIDDLELPELSSQNIKEDNVCENNEATPISLNESKVEADNSVQIQTKSNQNKQSASLELKNDEATEKDNSNYKVEQNEQKDQSHLLPTNAKIDTNQLPGLPEETEPQLDIKNIVDSPRRILRERRSSVRTEAEETKSKILPEQGKKRTRTSSEAKETGKKEDIAENNVNSQSPKLQKSVAFEMNDSDEVSMSEDENDIDDNFKLKDVRDAMFFNDYKVNDLCVHIRIQPEERNEVKEARYFCANCGFESLSVHSNRNHQESCSRFSYLDSSLLNDIHAPTKRVGKIEKIVYKPLDLDFHSFRMESNSIVFKDCYDISDSESGNEENSIEPQSLEGFKEKDIVWVNSTEELGLWPALIMKIIPNERKLFVKLIECPSKKQSFKVDVKSAISYNAGIRGKKMKWNGELTKACSKAEDYVRKRTLSDDANDSINAEKFFNFSKTMPSVASNVQSEISFGNSLQSPDQSVKPLPNIQVDSLKISSFIKQGSVDSHINSVCNEEKFQDYLKYLNENNDKYQRTNIFGPIKDEELQEELVNHCKNLSSSNDNIDFVLNVMIPQAIIKAISKLYNLDIAIAERIFDQGSTKQSSNAELL